MKWYDVSMQNTSWINVRPSRARLLPLGATVTLLGLGLAGFLPRLVWRSAPVPLTAQEQAAITPAQALERLKTGNQRFVSGHCFSRPWVSQRVATATAQHPYAFVLSCIDSRTSSEIVFDQGLGDLFNARIAGNVLSPDILGSMEFACQVAGARIIAVLGHTKCGAIQGACNGVQLGNLTGLLAKVQPCVDQAKVDHPGVPGNDPGLVAQVTELNVWRVMEQIRKESPILRDLIASGKVGLVGGVQDLATGEVQFFP